MQGRSPTIVDVAAAAGVSIGAVSKAMRGSYGVSAKTAEAVKRAIEDLDYRPKVGARSMRGSTFTLGLIVPGGFSPFFSEIYDGIVTELRTTDYRVIIAISDDGGEGDGRAAIDDVLDRQADGIILVAPAISRTKIEKIAERTPVVVVARHDSSQRYDAVYGDDAHGAKLVMEHLFAQGHTDIIHVANRDFGKAWPETPHGDHLRRRVYEQMMDGAGLGGLIRVIESRFEEATAYRSMQALIAERGAPSAIFAGADEAAFGVMRAIADLPAEVRSKIAVVGYDNTRFASHPAFALSSVDHSGAQLGRRAAALLLSRIDEARPGVQESLTPSLIVRASSSMRASDPTTPEGAIR